MNQPSSLRPFKQVKKPELNKYDLPGAGKCGEGGEETASLKGKCSFCSIIAGHSTRTLLYRDDICVIFRDRNQRAKFYF